MIAAKRIIAGERFKDRRESNVVDLCEYMKKDSGWSFEDLKPTTAKDFSVEFSSVLSHAQQLSLFVDIDPEILGGTPRIKDTRVPVYAILQAIEDHGTVEGAARAYRSVTVEAVKDALLFAANVLESPVEHKTPHFD